MKGPFGILVAAILGVAGMAVSWIYITNKTKSADTVAFIGVREGANLKKGDVIERRRLMSVLIPKSNAASLEDFALKWSGVDSLIGDYAIRDYKDGDLVLVSDQKKPVTEIPLKPEERLIWVTVDSKSFVPSHVDPGDQITFIVPTRSEGPTPATPFSEGAAERDVPLNSHEFIGPFTVGSLGNRLSSREVHEANKLRSDNERIVGVIVRAEGDRLDAKAMRLLDALDRAGHRNIAVQLHPRE